LCIAALYVSKLYRKNPYITSYRITMQSIKAAVFSVVFITAFQFVFKNLFADISGFSRGVFGLFGVLFGISIISWRLLFRRLEKWLHQSSINLDRVVLVGHDEFTQQIIDTIKQHPEWGIFLAGYVTTAKQESSIQNSIPYLGTFDDLERILPARKIDEVIITQSNLPLHDIERIQLYCKSFNIKAGIIPSSYSLLNEKSGIKQFGECRVISL
jgi:FlaA1/EpsC-like NDP-sugar epimerase